MRLAIFAISAVVAIGASGCSALGLGGHSGGTSAQCLPVGAGYGYQQADYQQAAYGYAGDANCVGGASYGAQGFGAGYGAQGYGAGYGAQGYGAQGAGFGAQGYGAGFNGQGYGAQGYGAGAGFGGAGYGAGGQVVGAGLAANGFGAQGYGAQGFGAQGLGGAAGIYGANGFQSTTLGANAPFGAAAYGQNVVGTQYSNGQFVGGQGVQTVVGAPVYVPQPYAAPYGVPQLRGATVGAAMPFGVEVFGGTDFDVSGDVFTAKEPGLAFGSNTVESGGSEGISYSDAFDQAKSVGGTLAYDASRNTTVLGTVGYSTADGQTVGSYNSVDARTPGTLEPINATFSDLDLLTVEGGLRQYVGANPAFRPYVGATAGFVHNNDVTIQRSYASDNVAYDAAPINYIESGWNPTASAVVGAEMAVGPRAAIGVESGVRWRDNMDTLLESEDRVSIPLKLRGRLAF